METTHYHYVLQTTWLHSWIVLRIHCHVKLVVGETITATSLMRELSRTSFTDTLAVVGLSLSITCPSSPSLGEHLSNHHVV